MKFHSKIFGWEYAWQEFANECGGTAELDPESQPSLKSISLPLPPKGTVTFAAVSHVGSGKPDASASACYSSDEQFVFALHTEKFIDQFGKLLGMQDITIGDSELDARFVIQSNDPRRLQAILQNADVRQLLLDRPELNLRVYTHDDKSSKGIVVQPGQHVIHYKQHGMIETFEELQAVYQLLSLLAKYSSAHTPQTQEADTFRPRFSESLLKR